MTGQWPVGEIDHINGNGSDNRWENLRQVTHKQNGANQGANYNNKHGFKGVRKRGNSWSARIATEKKERHPGSFSSKYQAAAAYDVAAVELFGEYARLNYRRPYA
jgi:hypothetical protein